MLKRTLLALLLFFSFIGAVSAQSASNDSEKVKWFTDARFGMFIHWGLYSAAEGIWEGERLRNGNNYAEWIRYRNRIPEDEYVKLAKRFDWNKIDPEQWVILAKKAGMKYILITAKHHDGIAIWNSKVSEHNLSKLSGTNRDVLKELAAACKKHGMKLGFYYSHWLDWEHPDGWDHNQEITGRITDEQYNKYWQGKVLPQLRELLTNYGDIAMIWFDMWVDYKTTIVKKEQLDQVIKLIHELQPACLINSRLGLPANTPGIDFETMGDNQLGAAYTNHPWETSGTIANSWGYNALENEYKSTSQLLQSLIGNVSLNGGFTLNIGPRADGAVPYEDQTRLNDMGAWLSKNGESVYGCTGLQLRSDQHDWGRITTKKLDNKQIVYLQVYNWPLDKILRLTGILSKPEKAELITDAGKVALSFTKSGPYTHIQLPDVAGDHFVSVIALQYAQPVELDEKAVAESTFGGLALSSNNASQNTVGYKKVGFDGVRPAHLIIDKNGVLTWQVYISAAGTYQADLSYHNDSKTGMSISISASDQNLSASLKPTGKVVVEPHDSYTDEFVNNPIGVFNFPKEGFYKITLTVNSTENEKLLFNRIWLSKKL
ncbi:alpha-L-fucosidase [Mucilaginibacter lappiensis]|uniref:alpha-L-fucosidase n=1 Tax=Mucilaginibacter lappiensis TaxID=354630 RepID=A0ABR6PG95_9SPHI|nr:alpha-L-fucosidase [Mucilaginibacter lappiensis]MBB6108777.1 alpha-L-fucosidase [Mucilaginibacter lappiensis]SIQ61822.1 alpha-L-fucosidase [Mucilaginibacter lappiensis]